jgi:hypothetical protein
MNVSITVVATKTLMAGRCRFSVDVDIVVPGVPGQLSGCTNAGQQEISVLLLPFRHQCFGNGSLEFTLFVAELSARGMT